MTRKTKRTAEDRVTRARSAHVVFQPFYGTLLMNLALEETKQFPTMATNGVVCLWNRSYVDGLADEEVLFVLAHEAEHVALLDHTRRGSRDPKLWNVATDYRINANLIKAGVGKMPKGGLFDPRFDGLAAEDIYAILAAEQKGGQTGQPGQPSDGEGDDEGQGGSGSSDDEGEEGEGQTGSGGDTGSETQSGSESGETGEAGSDTGETGSGAGDEADASDGEGNGGSGDGDEGDGEGAGANGPGGGCGDPGGCGEILDAPGDEAGKAEQEALWETVTRQAINVASKAAGKLPGHIERIASELGKPKQNWREILRRFVDQATTFDYSWKVPDRRFGAADFILPGTVSDGTHHVVIAVDTSGSINDMALARFRTEAQALLDEGAVDQITVIDCDAKVNSVETFQSGDLIAMTNNGGGGTSFRPVWEWLDKNPNDAAAVVYFTDLEPCDGFGNEPALPVLWAAYSTYGGPAELRRKMNTVPFGECIEITE